MASFLLDFATYLEEQGQGYTTGRYKDIFVFNMPENVNTALLLKDNPLGTDYWHELPGYFHTEFQVVVRAREHAEGEEKAEAVSTALTLLNQTVGTLNVNYVRPRHIPIVFPVSDGDFLEWLITFETSFCKLAS